MKTINMTIYFVLLFVNIVDSSIFNTLLVHTNYKNISQLSLDISKPSFFNSYLNLVNAEDIDFIPSLENKNIVNFPQEIIYNCIPNIQFIPKSVGKIKIHQLWELNNGVDFSGLITTDLITFKVKIIPFIYKNNVSLIFEGNIIKKSFFVPSQVVNQIIKDMERIFNLILNGENEEEMDENNL